MMTESPAVKRYADRSHRSPLNINAIVSAVLILTCRPGGHPGQRGRANHISIGRRDGLNCPPSVARNMNQFSLLWFVSQI